MAAVTPFYGSLFQWQKKKRCEGKANIFTKSYFNDDDEIQKPELKEGTYLAFYMTRQTSFTSSPKKSEI